MPGVITNSESPTAADHDRITATRETLEDYTLRLAPRSYRRWPPAVVGISALGGIAYLADFAIGANVGITWGTANALCGIAIFALVVFVTGLPLAYYAARYNIDLDLITRGSAFRLLRLGGHQRHLCHVHVHLLCPGGLDHGSGP